MRPRANPDLRALALMAGPVRAPLPRLMAPRYAQLPSGLLVPSTVADRIEAGPETWVPLELQPQARPVAIVDALPMSADQFAGAITEEDLGLSRSTLEDLIALVGPLPFERSILLVARLLAKLDGVREDAQAQLAIVRSWGMTELADSIEQALAPHLRAERRIVIFAEQYLTVLERLLIQHADPKPLEYDPTDQELLRLVAAIFAAGSVTGSADADLLGGEPNRERWLVYTLKNGLYNAKPPLVNEITRSRELFTVLASRLEHHDDFIPIDDWLREDYGLTAKEQLVAGEALAAAAHAFDDDAEIGDRSLITPPQWQGELEDRAQQIAELLTATREEFASAFAEYGTDLDSIAWERRPFLRHPFIRFVGGPWLLISPRAIATWIGEGFIHRVLAAAERRDLSLRATRFIGALFERYCYDLTRTAYPGERPIGGGRVHPEQPYETRFGRQMTSDIAIDLGTDIVLIEVVSARVTARMQVAGDAAQLEQNLERMVFAKLRQLSRVATDALAGTAPIPDVEPAHVERVWPVLVTAGELVQTEVLWDQIDERAPQGLRAARLGPLSVFDIGDFELLLALVSSGESLTGILERKAEGPYRRLEIARFAVDELGTEPTLRLPVIEERFGAQWEETVATLALHDRRGALAQAHSAHGICSQHGQPACS